MRDGRRVSADEGGGKLEGRHASSSCWPSSSSASASSSSCWSGKGVREQRSADSKRASAAAGADADPPCLAEGFAAADCVVGPASGRTPAGEKDNSEQN